MQDPINAPVNMEEISQSLENEISNLGADNAIIPATKVGKATKAGDKAPQEIIDLWKENGFSRYLNSKVKI